MRLAEGKGISFSEARKNLYQKISIRELDLNPMNGLLMKQLEGEMGKYCSAYSYRRKDIPFSGEIREVQEGGFIVGREFLDYENLMQVFVHEKV